MRSQICVKLKLKLRYKWLFVYALKLKFFWLLSFWSVPFRSYQAEISYLEVKDEERNSNSEINNRVNRAWESSSPSSSERVVCRVNCNICRTKPNHGYRGSTMPYSRPGEKRWLKSKGRYLSVGAAIISCRNERAPDGLVADAHLSDGLLHLVLIRDCPHAFYLWYYWLTETPFFLCFLWPLTWENSVANLLNEFYYTLLIHVYFTHMQASYTASKKRRKPTKLQICGASQGVFSLYTSLLCVSDWITLLNR